ncbi:MAG: hypothetical protein Q7T80_16590 [Methanoregula sp.]|nr:hypothetical protein [Methanoregula sp.]
MSCCEELRLWLEPALEVVTGEQNDSLGKNAGEQRKEKKVMCMEIALMNRLDVAEPDQSASGVAGTGLKDGRKTGIVEYGIAGNAASREKTGKNNRIVIGLGVLYNGGIQPPAPGEVRPPCPVAGAFRINTTEPAAPGPDPAELSGDLIFSCYERQERIYDRLNRKIGRLDQRLTRLETCRKEKREERGRPE